MPEARNWVAQITDTEGTVLALTLTGLFSDSASFAQAFNNQPAEVYYSIKNGDNREVGIGNFNGTTVFNRTTVTATLVSGVYDDSSPTRINLVGQSTVEVTFNAQPFNDLLAHVASTANPHATTAAQVGADPVGSSATVQSNLDTHIADSTNPHSVTAAQTGADPVGSAAVVQSDLDTHKANVSNPHNTTAALVGADPVGSSAAVQSNLDTHEADFGNPHNTTAALVGADPVGSAAAVQSNLDAHETDLANPHATTAAQTGAEPDLGNPTQNGQVLSSTIAGVREWVDQSGGGGSLDDLANVGTGEGNVWRDTAAGIANLKTLKAGTGVTISDLANEVQIDATGVGGGEANTSSNNGVGGVGLALPKAGVNLPFKNINAENNKITITDDVGNNEVDIGVNESNFAHMQNTSNPHSTTAAQVGADPVGSAAAVQVNLDAHEADFGNPHNTTAIQVGATPEAPADGNKYSRQNNAWVQSPRTPIGGLYGRFTFSTNTSPTDPGPGGIKVNNADLSLATELYVSGTTRFGAAVDPDFLTWGPQDFLGLFDELQGNGAFYAITGNPVDNTGWYTFPISSQPGSDSSIVNSRDTVLTEVTAPGSRIPRGGLVGQAVTKTGANDFETGWSNFDVAGSAALVQSNLDAHEADLANPHATTAAQVGADPVGSADTVQTNLDTHIADSSNPHSVTAAQTGAEPDLDNPTQDGQVLSSTIAGVRSWVDQSGGGDVVGPASSVDNRLSLFDGVTGKLIKQASIVEAAVVALSVNNQLAGLTQKTTPAPADLLLIEDSVVAGQKKRVPWSSLPSGGGGIPDAPDALYGYLREGDTNNTWVRGSRVFEQATAPSTPSIGDVWIDTT